MSKLVEAYKELHSMTDEKFNSFKSVDEIAIHSGTLFTEFEEFETALKGLSDKHVVIHPDYDADGVMGGVTAKVGLDILGVAKKVDLYYPKTTYGYGLTPKAVDEILTDYPTVDVIYTVDNGINTKEAVDYAVEKDLDVIVTDHHKPQAEFFPDKAIAVVNPKRMDKEETYPYTGISGTQVTWKLLMGYAEKNQPEKVTVLENLQPFSGISIISDVMPILDENRRILRETVEHLSDPLWLQARQLDKDVPISYTLAFRGLYNLITYLKDTGVLADYQSFSYDTIGFYIAPMINAPRRMVNDSRASFEVFTSLTSPDGGKSEVQLVNELNVSRKEEVSTAFTNFTRSANHSDLAKLKGIVYADDNLRHGIAGLIASKIMGEFHVPVIVLGGKTGSGRSPQTFNLHQILGKVEERAPELFAKWGGHEQAAGLTINDGQLELFKQLFDEEAHRNLVEYQKYSHITREDSIKLDIDDLPTFKDVQIALAEFEQLKPYSDLVPAPKFELVFNYQDFPPRYLGKNEDHVKFEFGDFKVIIWGAGEKIKNISSSDNPELSVVGELALNVWKNFRSVQLTSQFIGISFEGE